MLSEEEIEELNDTYYAETVDGTTYCRKPSLEEIVDKINEIIRWINKE